MINISEFITNHITCRSKSLFLEDIKSNKAEIQERIYGKSVLVIGGAGTIGASFIRAVLPFKPAKLVVIDISENGLTELTRDLRSTEDMFVPEEYHTYPISFSDAIFEKIFRAEKGFDIVANFSAHKHVRSEKDKYSVEALIENNVLKAKHLLDLMVEYPPKNFFCVSTDKAANPVNIMGASKLLMEKLIMAYKDKYPVTTARFANVAFSNGSLPAGWIDRVMKKQPLVAPLDVKRYFVSPEESGQICMLACLLGNSGEVFFPKLAEEAMKTFSSICDCFIEELGYVKKVFKTDAEAKSFASKMTNEGKEYPVVYTQSDTTGEKSFEEFYVAGEKVNTNRFNALGVIEDYQVDNLTNFTASLESLKTVFQKESFTKNDVVKELEKILPNFKHEEKGKNLDQKM